MKAIVTAAPRSGTGYIAVVLNEAGLPGGHESVFGLGGIAPFVSRAFDSSWLAAPRLANIRREGAYRDVKVGHQLRDPLAVVRSVAGIRWGRRYRDFADHHLPDLDDARSREEWAITLWCGWVDMIAPHATATWRVEDLVTGNLAAQDALSRTTGVVPTRLAAAIARVPGDINTRPHGRVNFGLVRDDLWDAFVERATYYGYPPPER